MRIGFTPVLRYTSEDRAEFGKQSIYHFKSINLTYFIVSIDGRHLTQESSISPSFMHKRRIVDVDMHDLKNDYSQMTHVVVKVAPNDDPVLEQVNINWTIF